MAIVIWGVNAGELFSPGAWQRNLPPARPYRGASLGNPNPTPPEAHSSGKNKDVAVSVPARQPGSRIVLAYTPPYFSSRCCFSRRFSAPLADSTSPFSWGSSRLIVCGSIPKCSINFA